MKKKDVLAFVNQDDLDALAGVGPETATSYVIKEGLIPAGISFDTSLEAKVPANVDDYRSAMFRRNPSNEDLGYLFHPVWATMPTIENPYTKFFNRAKQYQGLDMLKPFLPEDTNIFSAWQLPQIYSALNDIGKKGKEGIIKPGTGFGGAGVKKIEQMNPVALFFTLANYFVNNRSSHFITQQYDEVIGKSGDTRVIYVAGEPVASLRRIPADGDFRSNRTAGGTVAPVQVLDAETNEVAQGLRDIAQKLDVIVGADIANKKALELNVGSTGGGNYVDRFNKNSVYLNAVMDYIESKLSMKPDSSGLYVPEGVRELYQPQLPKAIRERYEKNSSGIYLPKKPNFAPSYRKLSA